MNPADVILIVSALQGGVRGGTRGFLREAWSTVGMAVGLVVAVWGSPQLASEVQRWVTIPLPLALGGVFCVLFFLLSGAAGLAALWFPLPVGRVGRIGSRIGGVAVGIAKGVVVGAALLVGIDVFRMAPGGDLLVSDSVVARALVGKGRALLRVEVLAEAKASGEQPGS